MIRGARFDIPLELRVHVGDLPLTNGRKIHISGHRLHLQGRATQDPESLDCHAKPMGSTQIFDTNLQTPPLRWECQSGSQKYVLNKPAVVTTQAGFLSVDDRMFRGALELHPHKQDLFLINLIEIDDYLAGLVNKEFRSSWPTEAVKAQVVAARSYALATAADRRSADHFFDLTNTEADQVYDGFIPEDGPAFRRVRETRNMVLTFEEQLLKAFYHASNGGHSELPNQVWGAHTSRRDHYAYQARPSPIDLEVASFPWNLRLSAATGGLFAVGNLSRIQVLERSTGGRVQRIKLTGDLGEKTVTGFEFRSKLGNRLVKSTLFWPELNGNHWELKGRGFGHGVGLSQWGAKAMAERGSTMKEILKHYYPAASLRLIDVPRAQQIVPPASPDEDPDRDPKPFAR